MNGSSAADGRGGGGGGNRGSLPPGPQCKGGRPNSAGLVQIRSARQSHSSLAFLRGWFRRSVFSNEVSLLFCFAFYAADANNAQLSYVATAQSAPYVVLFDLKPLIEDGNLQVYMHCACTERACRSPQNTLQSM